MARRRGQNVSANLEGLEGLQAALEKMLADTDDLSDVWRDIYHEAVLEGESNYFSSDGDNSWPDLTSRYLFYKSRHGGGTKTLLGTPNRRRFPRIYGTLRDSLTSKGSPLHIFDVNARWMRSGSRDKLANIFFTKKGRRKRKPMDAKSASMQVAFQTAVQEHAKRYSELWGGTT